MFWGILFLIFVSILSFIILKLTHVYLSKYSVELSLASAVLGITGTIYAVMLAMISVDVLNIFMAAEQNILFEANNVGNVFRFGQHFPDADAAELKKVTHDYLNYVLNVEIPAQDVIKLNIDSVKIRGYDYLDKITEITMNSKAPELLKERIFNSLDAITIHRRMRIAASNAHLPSFLWWVLGLGCILLILV